MAYKKRETGEGTLVGFREGQPVYRKAGGYAPAGKAKPGYKKEEKPGYKKEEKPGYKKADRPGGGKGGYGKAEYPFKSRAEQEQAAAKAPRGSARDRKAPEAAEAAPAQPNQADELPYLVMGRNPVREALRSGRSIDRLLVVKEQDGSLGELITMARDRQIQVREVDRAKLDELCMPFGHGGRTGNHQGVVAQVPGVEYCDISDILNAAKEKGQPPFVLLLDGIEDPHNLGSIIRSAECAGAHGVIIPKRRASGVTAAACKASAGAVEYMRVARVSNLSGAIARLKDEGLWIAGADMGGSPMASANMKGALGLVIGGEGGGISKLVKDNCDFLVSIPLFGRVDSLNAAVAAAVLMFEKRRQDG